MPRKIIFIHQNLPGQFKHLLRHCAGSPDYQVMAVGEKRRVLVNFPNLPPSVGFHVYDIEDIPADRVPAELRSTANAMRRGRAVALCLENIKQSGFVPDVIYGHPGWGELLHVRDVFPHARVVNYCEFYFNRNGQDLDFDPEFALPEHDYFRVRTDNMTQLVSLVEADVCISPTLWQKLRYPASLQARIEVIHDGIDLNRVKPDSHARISLPGGKGTLGRETPVITYVARNLEPYRGFHRFMRAVPDLLRAVPDAHVVVVGGDEVSYGTRRADGRTYRAAMLEELGGRLDPSRVHFLGRIPYNAYLSVLQVSRVHVYLSYPFVLSWSFLEAMAAGAVVVGSRTEPVEEVIQDGVNGHLVDFFSNDELVDTIRKACVEGTQEAIRKASMTTVARDFDLRTCLARQLERMFQGVDVLESPLVEA